MQHIAIIYKRTRPDAADLARDLTRWLVERNIKVYCRENPDYSGVTCDWQGMEIPETIDLAVVLGGDGTLLSAARLLERRPIPIVGVNLGGLGFLTVISRESCFSQLQSILDGYYELEERMRLKVTILRDQKEIFTHRVLNDAVINKGALARIVELKTSIDGSHLTHYRGDGLIVSTPTGSTAYNLAAGGPIIYPTSRTIILTPICSFTLTNRPIILPAHVNVEVEVGERVSDATLTCDGQVGCEILPLDRIVITAAYSPLRLVKTTSIDYFEILRSKLKWGTY